MLKNNAANGLSKVWKPIKTFERLYTGDILISSHLSSAIFTILNGQVTCYDVASGSIQWKLGEDVTCFCMTPDETSIIVATNKSLLQHFRYAL